MITNSTTAVANDIHDIKPPLEISNGPVWLWWTLGAIVLVTVLLWAWRHFLKQVTKSSPPPPVPAHQRAKKKLAEALALIAQPKPFCVLVSDTARAYLEERFQFRAPERTTEEFLHELRGTNLLLPDQKDSLGNFLASCDLVKFAKYEPAETELLALHSSALRLVEETEPKEAESGKRESGKAETISNQQSQISNPPATALGEHPASGIQHPDTK